MGMVFAALAFGAATLVEINVVVRTNQHNYHLHLVQFGLENHVTETGVVISLFLKRPVRVCWTLLLRSSMVCC